MKLNSFIEILFIQRPKKLPVLQNKTICVNIIKAAIVSAPAVQRTIANATKQKFRVPLIASVWVSMNKRVLIAKLHIIKSY